MDRTAILEVLHDWNHWDRPPDTGTPREVLPQLKPLLGERHILAVTGVRRCGKSTLLLQMGELIAGEHGRNQVLHVNFEDPRWLGELSAGLLDRIVSTYREHRNPTDKAFLLFDEVQAVPDWERWVRSVYDRAEPLKVIVSGSTASLIGGKLGALLTGRHLSVELYPFSLRERLLHDGIALPEDDYYALRRHKSEVRAKLADLLEAGGFPEACTKPEELRRRILQQYFEDIIARDILIRQPVRDVPTLRTLAQYLVTNIGNELASTNVAKSLGVSPDTVREYLGYLQETYLVSAVSYASSSLKVVARRNAKVYAVDCGLRNAVSVRFSRDTGRLAENLVFLHLRSQRLRPRYWRNGGEVDFVTELSTGPLALTVCSTDALPERELRSMRQAMISLGVCRGLVITDDRYSGAEAGPEGPIGVVPLWYFLVRPLEAVVEEVFA